MLFKDFFFGFKNIHVSFLEKKKISKLIRVGILILLANSGFPGTGYVILYDSSENPE